MAYLERLLVKLDSWPWNMVWRFGLGLSLPPIFHALAGYNAPVWVPLALFLCFLIGLYVVSVLLRHALPFSFEAKAIWSERRKTARRHDSFQWQKLLWVGFGLVANAILVGGLKEGELLLTLICLIGGGAGLFFWRQGGHVWPVTRARP